MKIIQDLRDLTVGCEINDKTLSWPDLLSRKKSLQDDPMLLLTPTVVWNFSIRLDVCTLGFSYVETMRFTESNIEPENAEYINTIRAAKSEFPEIVRYSELVEPSPRYQFEDPTLPESREAAEQIIQETFPENFVCPLLVSRLFSIENIEHDTKSVRRLAFAHIAYLSRDGISIKAEYCDRKRKFNAEYKIVRKDSSFSVPIGELERIARNLSDPKSIHGLELLSKALESVRTNSGEVYYKAIVADFLLLGSSLLPIGKFITEMLKEVSDADRILIENEQKNTKAEIRRFRIAELDRELKRLELKEEKFLKSQQVAT